MAELRKIKIYRATNRHVLFLGAERELSIMLVVVCFALVFSALNMISFAIGVVLWIVGQFLLKLMASKDPQLSKIFLNYCKYDQKIYPASSSPWSKGFGV